MAGDQSFGFLRRRLRDAAEKADGALGFIDQPNANMAWELGQALGNAGACRPRRDAPYSPTG